MLALLTGSALVACLVAATGNTAAAGSTAAQGRAGGSRPAVLAPAVQWGSCPATIPAQFQCATEPVPLNYQHPAGQQISLALIRLPASDPSERIGSLFIDFGGPGGPDVTDLVNGNARLLKVNGDGHTSMFVEPSVCRDDAELAYLVSLQLPAKGTTCNVDQLPFGLSPGP
jgi:hypothetical protein